MLLRSGDGTPTYRAADVVYVVDKLERGFDRAIYVLGADHHGTRNWYGAVARMLGYDPERLEVLLYQLVHLTRGGEQTKMSKRRGDVVFLDDFVDEIGVDAARWYLVNRGPDQTIEIDIDLAAERSQKNPVYYVQYAHARIAGILRNAGDAAVSAEPAGPLAPEERELVKRLAEFPRVAADAAEKRGPQAVPAYAIRVADDFHRFYHEHRVLESDQQAFRLGLCRATARGDRALPRPRRGRGAGAYVTIRAMSDGLLLSRRERLARFETRFGAGLGPSLALVAAAFALGADAVGIAIAVTAVLCALLVGTSARTLRGAVVAGLAIAVALFLFQLVLAWFITHPVLRP